MNYSFDFKIYKMSDDKEFNHLVGLEKKVLKWKRTARPRRWLWNARVNDQILSSGSEDGFQEPGDQEPERATVVPPPVQADDFDLSVLGDVSSMSEDEVRAAATATCQKWQKRRYSYIYNCTLRLNG